MSLFQVGTDHVLFVFGVRPAECPYYEHSKTLRAVSVLVNVNIISRYVLSKSLADLNSNHKSLNGFCSCCTWFDIYKCIL